VKIQLKLVSKSFLGFEDVLQKSIEWRVVVLLVHHVESNHKLVAKAFVFLYFQGLRICINHFLDVAFADQFKACNNYLHPEKWELCLQYLLDIFENLHLSFQADRTIVIKHTSENVAVLNNSD